MKKFILSIFVLAGVGVPLLFTPFLFSGFELGKAILLRFATLVALLSILFVVIKHGKFYWIKISSKLWIVLGFFILFNVLACVFSISPMISFWGSYERQHGLLQLLYYILFFLLFINFVEKSDVKKIIYWLCATGVFISLIAILQNYFGVFLSLWDTNVLVGRTAIGTMGQPNFLASYLIMLIPFFIVFIFETKSLKKYLWLSGIILITWAVLLTLSRGAIVGMITMFVFMGLFYKRKLLVIPIFITAIVLFANVFSGQQLIKENRLLNRLILNGESLRSVESRLEIWPATLKMIKQRPLLGYGQEVFKESFAKFSPPILLKIEDTHSKADRAHNELLDLASSIGILGLLSYLALLFNIIKVGVEKRSELILFACSSSLFVVFVNNMFGFSTTTTHTLWWIIFGIVIVSVGEKNKKEIRFSKKNMLHILSYLIVIPLILFSLIFTIIKPVVADIYYKKGHEFASALLYFNAVDYFKNASEINPYEVHYAIRGAEFSVIGARHTPEYYYHNLLVMRADWFLKRIEKLGAGNFAETLLINGQIFSLRNAPDLAIELLNLANKKAPTNLRILLELANVYVQKKSPSEAIEVYKKYLELMPYWNEAFNIENATDREKFLFRIFFKGNPEFIRILKNIANVADSAGMTIEADTYRSYAKKIDKVMETLTK